MCITVIYLIIINNNNKNDISNHKRKIRRERKIANGLLLQKVLIHFECYDICSLPN